MRHNPLPSSAWPRALCALLALPSFFMGCGDALECGSGTIERQGRCEPLAGGDALFCAQGTKREGNSCIPEATITCGEGTKLIADRCVSDEAMITCGDHTMLVGAQCVGEEPGGLSCGAGTTALGQACVSAQGIDVATPLQEGTLARLIQGFHGGFSHQGFNTFALDFDVPEGTPIAAAKAGLVIGLKEDSNEGCGDISCGPKGNFIRIDHGDGTFGVYYHLRHQGVEVELGQSVCQGEIIGYSGNTGFSTGPHLHFEVTDALNMSQPLRLPELEQASHGVPFEGASYRSQNAPQQRCQPPDTLSDCSAAFAIRGVILDEPLPCGDVPKDTIIKLKGRAAQPGQDIILHQYSDVSGEWLPSCINADSQGRFEYNLTWPSAKFNASQTWLNAALTAPGCPTWRGWAASMMVWLRPNN